MKTAVIVPAAGRSSRFLGHSEREGPSKVEMELGGRAIFLRALEPFVNRPDVGQVLLAVSPQRYEAFALQWGDRLRLEGVQLVVGGERERWETVRRALGEVADDCTHVAVHDAARPFVSGPLIDRVFQAAYAHGAVIPAQAVTETIKRVVSEEVAEPPPEAEPSGIDAILGAAPETDQTPPLQHVVETLDRADLVAVQTPQVFERRLLQRAYEALGEAGEAVSVTDDASLVEALGEPVHVVPGDRRNLKITTPDDLDLAEALLARQQETEAGQRARRTLGDEEEEFLR